MGAIGPEMMPQPRAAATRADAESGLPIEMWIGGCGCCNGFGMEPKPSSGTIAFLICTFQNSPLMS